MGAHAQYAAKSAVVMLLLLLLWLTVALMPMAGPVVKAMQGWCHWWLFLKSGAQNAFILDRNMEQGHTWMHEYNELKRTHKQHLYQGVK